MILDVLFAIARLLFGIVIGIADWWSRRREGVAVRLRKGLAIKAELSENLPRVLGETNGDVVIRELRRKDSYPEIDDSLRRISPWFNAELKGLYFGGLEVFLRIESVLIEDGVAKPVHPDEPRTQNVFIVGRIPFWRIEAIDWEGDEYYGFTHLYCRFRWLSKGPYESIVLYETTERSVGGRIYYSRLDGVRWKPTRHGLLARWKDRRELRKAQEQAEQRMREVVEREDPPE